MKFRRKKELNKLSMVKMHLGINEFDQYFTTLVKNSGWTDGESNSHSGAPLLKIDDFMN